MVAGEFMRGGGETKAVLWEGAAQQVISGGKEVEAVFCEVAAEEKMPGKDSTLRCRGFGSCNWITRKCIINHPVVGL